MQYALNDAKWRLIEPICPVNQEAFCAWRWGKHAAMPQPGRSDLLPPFRPYLYGDRNLVERFFNRIEHCCRIATRYEKRTINFLAFVKLAAIRL